MKRCCNLTDRQTDRQADALTLHRIHAVGYIFKPYDKETLEDSLAHLRYPIREVRNIY